MSFYINIFDHDEKSLTGPTESMAQKSIGMSMLFTLTLLPVFFEALRSRKKDESCSGKVWRIIFAPFWSLSEINRAPAAYKRFEEFRRIDKNYSFENLNKKELVVVKRLGFCCLKKFLLIFEVLWTKIIKHISIPKRYYEGIFSDHSRRVVYSVRESTVQLIYYNALIFYQKFRFPLRELQYSRTVLNPTFLWVTSLVLQILTGHDTENF